MSDEHFRALSDVADKIAAVLDPDCGIVSALFSRGVFTIFDRQRINATRTYTDKASAIVETLLRKFDGSFDIFLDALDKTGHEHVLHFMGRGGSPPVQQEFLQYIEKSRADIIQFMDPEDSGLLDMMVSWKVLSDYDRIDDGE